MTQVVRSLGDVQPLINSNYFIRPYWNQEINHLFFLSPHLASWLSVSLMGWNHHAEREHVFSLRWFPFSLNVFKKYYQKVGWNWKKPLVSAEPWVVLILGLLTRLLGNYWSKFRVSVYHFCFSDVSVLNFDYISIGINSQPLDIYLSKAPHVL